MLSDVILRSLEAIPRTMDRRIDEVSRSVRLGSPDARARKCLVLGPKGESCQRWSDWKVMKL